MGKSGFSVVFMAGREQAYRRISRVSESFEGYDEEVDEVCDKWVRRVEGRIECVEASE